VLIAEHTPHTSVESLQGWSGGKLEEDGAVGVEQTSATWVALEELLAIGDYMVRQHEPPQNDHIAAQSSKLRLLVVAGMKFIHCWPVVTPQIYKRFLLIVSLPNCSSTAGTSAVSMSVSPVDSATYGGRAISNPWVKMGEIIGRAARFYLSFSAGSNTVCISFCIIVEKTCPSAAM
jgi:hypothetical protein